MRNWYKRGDTKLKALIVSISRIFKKSRLTLDFDNINKPVSTMRETSITIYRELEKKNRSAFLDLGLLVYMEAYAEAKPESKPDKDAAQEKINEKWLDSLQGEYNPVTKYVYAREVERKRARFFESTVADIEAKDRRGLESDYRTAENLWTRQTRQAMIDVEDRAAHDGYKAAGVKRVQWITQQDAGVCSECKALNGLIFPIDRIPDKPHYNCRCYVRPIDDNVTE